MKVRILYKEDGTIGVIHPAPKSKNSDETDEQWLERVFNKATPEELEYEDIDESELPKDRETRNAWTKKKGKKIEIDKTKSKEIKDEKKIAEEMKEINEKELRVKAIDSLKAKNEL